MYKFNWSELITDNLFNSIVGDSGINLKSDEAKSNLLLSSIFKSVGGLPISENELNENQKTILAEKLFSDGLQHYLSKCGTHYNDSGYYLETVNNESYEKKIVVLDKLNVNYASISQLEKLPIIGLKLAESIVNERLKNGIFKSFDDLINRVKGLGENVKDELYHALSFLDVSSKLTKGIEKNLTLSKQFLYTLSLFPGLLSDSKAVQLLENIATTLASENHPKTVDKQIRNDLNLSELVLNPIDSLSILEGSTYFKFLPLLIQQATQSIRIAMFHIALPTENHPTKILLEELIKAKKRGLTVQVVVDQDRPSDPYKSTVVNAKAKEFFEANGITCKSDTKEVLLHSKYLIIDDKIAVLGSHNWSAGSYFAFDDLSLVLRSEEICSQLNRRFENLWNL